MNGVTEMIKSQLEGLEKTVTAKEFVNGKHSMGLELDIQLSHINTISLLVEMIGHEQGSLDGTDELIDGTISGIAFLLQHHVEIAKHLSSAIQSSVSNRGAK